MPIYTKKGDKGETSLFGGIRVPKYSLRVETYGTVDELNSTIGLVIVQSSKLKVKSLKRVKSELNKLQNDLLEIGSALANPKAQPLIHLEKRVREFELLIDFLTEHMPLLRNFILPGGGETGAMLHLARTVCRRVERKVVELASKETIDGEIVKYFNRLSDLLFTMSRFANFQEGKKETIWKVV